MRPRVGRRSKLAAAVAALGLLLTACNNVVTGVPGFANAPDAHLDVQGVDSASSFDTTTQNALSDIEAFWKINFPKVSGGKTLTPLKGGLYSVDGGKVVQERAAVGPVRKEACAQQSIDFLVNNGAYCRLDDSIVWDRNDEHLFAQLAKRYGDFTVALIFAHEFGHSISERLGVFDQHQSGPLTESQADCAAGAWAKSAIEHQDPHFRDATPAKLDAALEGFLDGRDQTPDTDQDISHGNGFDRLSAVADGYDKGVTYCYGSGFFASRSFTERTYGGDEKDAAQGGNEPLADVTKADSSNEFVTDLNRFWTGAAKDTKKGSFTPVKIAEADHPKCAASSGAEFGYCPDDNTVYFDADFARKAYYSFPDVQADPTTANVKLLFNQPADFALGTMFGIAWGFAVRHQLFDRPLDDKSALLAGVCYTGAYAKNINVSSDEAPGGFFLSPSDLDEGVAATLNVVPQPNAFGARGTTGLDRVQAFIRGYKGGLAVC